MSVTFDELKWWQWIIGVGLMVISAIFGAGMASQRFLSSIQNRILSLERNVKSFYKPDETIKFMTVDDFRREQHNCQLHMAEIFSSTKEAIRDLKNSVDELVKIMINKHNID